MKSANHCVLLIIAAVVCIVAASEDRPYRRSFVNPYPRFKFYSDGVDPGEPLFLTPLINDASLPKEKVQKLLAFLVLSFMELRAIRVI